MKLEIKKIIKTAISTLTIATMVTASLPTLPVYAANVSKASNLDGYADSTASNASDLSAGEDTSQGVSTKYKEFAVAPDDPVTQTYKTDVYVTQSTEFSVVAPVIAVISGTKDKADNLYKGYVRYSVSGNIASDQAVIVEPDSSFKLAQSGKNDIDCTVTGVNNAKTSFTYADGLRKDNSLTSDYVLSTSDMTAGKWNGTYHTNISLSTEYEYYSSIERAANDANNLTNENADIARSNIENAEAALTFEDNKAKIMLFRNAEDVEEIDLTQDTTIDMNAKSINFASGKGFSTNNNLTLYDGTINATNPGTTATASTYALITNANPDATLTLNDCIINDEHTADTSKNTYEIYSKGYVNFDSATEINSTGAGNSNYFFASMFVLNPTVNNVKNAKINMTIDNAKSLRGIQTNAGEFNVDNLKMKLTLKKGYAYGLYQSVDKDASITNSSIDIDIENSGAGSNYGIAIFKAADVVLKKNNITVSANSTDTSSTTKNNMCVYLNGGTTTSKKVTSSDNVFTNSSNDASNTNEFGYSCMSTINLFKSTNDTIKFNSKSKGSYGINSVAQATEISGLTSNMNINATDISYGVRMLQVGSKDSTVVNSTFTGEQKGTGEVELIDSSGITTVTNHNEFNFTGNTGITTAIRAYDTTSSNCTLEANYNNITLNTKGTANGFEVSNKRKTANLSHNEVHITSEATKADGNINLVRGVLTGATDTTIDNHTSDIKRLNTDGSSYGETDSVYSAATGTNLTITNSNFEVNDTTSKGASYIIKANNSGAISVKNNTVSSNTTNGNNVFLIGKNNTGVDVDELNLTLQRSNPNKLESTLTSESKVLDVDENVVNLTFSNSEITVDNNTAGNNVFVQSKNTGTANLQNVTINGDCISGQNTVVNLENSVQTDIDNFHFTGDSTGTAKFIKVSNNSAVATINDVSFNGQSTKEQFYGISFSGKQADITKVNIDAKAVTLFSGIGISNKAEIGNMTDVTVKGYQSAGNRMYGIQDYAKQSTIINPVVNIKYDGGSSAYGIWTTGDKTDITNLSSEVTTKNGSCDGAVIGSTVGIIKGCKINADSTNGAGAMGMQLKSDSGSISASDDFPVSVFGKEWGIQRTVPGGKFIVNNGTFTSCSHPAYICSNIEFNNSVFYLDRVENYENQDNIQTVGGIYFGTGSDWNVTGTEKAVFNNCQIGSPLECNNLAQHCIVDQTAREYLDPESVDFNNCTLYSGSKDLIAFQAGYFTAEDGLSPIDFPCKTKFNINEGTTLYVRDTSSGTISYREYTADDLAKDVLASRRTRTVKSTYYNSVQEIRSGPIFFTEFVDSDGNVSPLWTDSANVYDNR